MKIAALNLNTEHFTVEHLPVYICIAGGKVDSVL